MDEVARNLADIRKRITLACKRSGRSTEDVRLIAVSKTFDADVLVRALRAGQQDFGESYVQEAMPKIAQVDAQADRRPCWHFMGPIQSNKTSTIAAGFDWAHAVDRLKIAERLSAQRHEDQRPLNLCVQVNVSGEASKAGCVPEDAAALCAAIAKLPGIHLRGLMCIPEAVDEAGQTRPAFRAMCRLRETIRAAGHVDTALFDTLSMGMSDDFEIAIEEGATMIRIGTAIFGHRPRVR